MFRPIALSTVMLLLSVMFGSAGYAQEVPFTGVVVQDAVKARAGAGRAYYVVGDLKQGQVVQVDEVIFGWNKIVTPPGVYSYISKAFVDARGNGKIGHVNSDRVEVKAGSIKGPGESYRGQVVLNKGDTVDILAEEGSFYRITPPKGAYVFLPPGSVRRADPQQLAAPSPEPAAPAQAQPPTSTQPPSQTQAAPEPAPAPQPAPQPQPQQSLTLRDAMQSQPPEPGAADDVESSSAASVDAPAITDETAPRLTPPSAGPAIDAMANSLKSQEDTADAETTPDPSLAASPDAASQTAGEAPLESPAVSAELQALERRMVPLFMQPLEEQPLADMIRAYQNIQQQSLPAVDRQIVRMRLAALERNQQIADALRQIQISTSNPTQVELPDARAAAPAGTGAEAASGAPVRYNAVGRLLASSVYDGISLPRMFRIVDPSSGRTLLWVEPGGPVDPKVYLGKVVGVVGPQQYDPALKFNVLDVQRIDILEAQPLPEQQS